jgi:hypothetical protein
MELRNLIDTHLDLARLSRDLDEVGHFARVWSTSQWSREDQAKVFEAAKDFRPLSLDDFVPPSVAARTEVTHIGKNTLGAFTHFEKHLFKPARDDAKDVLVGRNFQSTSTFTGPGFFVARPGTEAGEVEFDYAATPAETLDSWGAIRPNAGGISALVYGDMFDVMRGVSSHVTIGRLKKKGRLVDNWFVLVRQDVGEPGGNGSHSP